MIISNATPLISFARINQLPLLQKVVGTLVIPTGVAQEIAMYQSNLLGSINLSQEPWIQTRPLASDQQVQLLLPSLDQGEAEVIALALELRPQLVLMDELTRRKVAESLGLTVSGSVGVLIRAKELGYLPEIKPYLQQMKQSGIYFSDRFIQGILNQVNET
jgi:predicted nucleic acid-binding protein